MACLQTFSKLEFLRQRLWSTHIRNFSMAYFELNNKMYIFVNTGTNGFIPKIIPGYSRLVRFALIY